MKQPPADLIDDLKGQMVPSEAAAILERLATGSPPIPAPSPAETAALIAQLRPLMPPPRPTPAPAPRFRDEGLEPNPVPGLLRYLLPQARLFRPVWWLGSLGAVLLGLLLERDLTALGIPLSALAPLLVIGGVLYAFRPLQGGALELELTCPVTPAQVALGRILIMMGYWALLGGALALRQGAPLLLLDWCASLFLFTGLMLTLSIFTGTMTATVVSTTLWGALLVLQPAAYSLPALAAGLALLALALSGPGLRRLVGRGDH